METQAGCPTFREKRQGGAFRPPAMGDKTDTKGGDICQYFDHTILKPGATMQEVKKLCSEAISYGFKAVCVNSSLVGFAARFLDGHATLPIAVVGFPLGAGTSGSKAFEAKDAVRAGAKEIDMVINVGRLHDKDYAYVLQDIVAVVAAAEPCPVKVIIEACLLNADEKIIACALAKAGGAQFVKTSTGFSKSGASLEDVALMRRVVGPDMGVKASGGIRTKKAVLEMIRAGANRVGASKSVQIMTETAGQGGPAGEGGASGGAY